MSATTIRGSSPAQEIYSGNYPLAQRGVLIGFPNTGPLHTLGYWQSDNAIDIAVAVGTDVVAVTDGIVRARGDWSVPYDLTLSASGWDLLLFGDDGANYFYSRLSQRYVADGEHVVQGQVIGKSGGATSVPHLHVAIQPQPANQAPNPSFEHDALGAAPAGWANIGTNPHVTFQAQNAWASEGAQSLYAVTDVLANAALSQAMIDTGLKLGGLSWVYVVTPGQQVAVRADVNVLSIIGSMSLSTQVIWNGPTGAPLSTSTGVALGGAATTVTPLNVVDGGGPTTSFVDNYDGGVPSTSFVNSLDGGTAAAGVTTSGGTGLTLGTGTLSDLFTAPAGAGLARISFVALSGAQGSSMSYYLDGVMVVIAPAGSLSVMPGYNDSDQPTNPQLRWG